MSVKHPTIMHITWYEVLKAYIVNMKLWVKMKLLYVFMLELFLVFFKVGPVFSPALQFSQSLPD